MGTSGRVVWISSATWQATQGHTEPQCLHQCVYLVAIKLVSEAHRQLGSKHAKIWACLRKLLWVRSYDSLHLFQLCRKPALVLSVRTKASTPQQAFAIRLLTAVPQGTFPLQSLRASRNSLRSIARSGSSGETEPTLLPTPHYNTGIIQASHPFLMWRTFTSS